MAHKLEKFYSSFGGVDTRSNKLFMDPKTFRNGSKNFRYNFQDEIQNANGFQHKTPVTPVEFVDIFEYKYRDINTGASSSQLLGVGEDGNLYRKVSHSLVWNTTAGAGYSFLYNEVADRFELIVNGSTVVVSESMTLDQLKTALNALPGINVSVLGASGAAVVSTHLAYLLDCVIDNAFQSNTSWSWEVVPCSGVPFPNAITQGEGYEGVSSVNINNAIYITDGMFPMKYDGASVYRAGMPRFTRDLGFNGTTLADHTAGALDADATYRYIMQFGFVDVSGAETLGKIVETDFIDKILPPSFQSIFLPIFPIGNSAVTNDCFPVYSCTVNADQTFGGTGSKVLNVDSGHNIKVGMCLRLTVSNVTGSGIPQGVSFGYLSVTAVTATTITFNKTIANITLLQSGTASGNYSPMWLKNSSSQTSNLIPNDLVINGCYVPDELVGIFTDPDADYNNTNDIMAWSPAPIYGAFCRVYRSQGNAVDQLYKIADLPVSHANFYYALDMLADNGVDPDVESAPGITYENQTYIQIDYGEGEEIPRACKYLTKWQGLIVQAGRPLNEIAILNQDYPWYYAPPPPTTSNKWNQAIPFPPWTYQENNLCDFQSIYWADPITPEGFPQDGLHEFSIDTEFSDEIKGIAENKDALFALKARSTGVITGDLGTNDLDLEILEDDIGCISHRTIQSVKGALMWLDGEKGFYACVAGRLPEHVGYPICDYQQINAQKLDYAKAVAMDARSIDAYICVVGSTWFAFDYSETEPGRPNRNCWYIWERFTAKSVCYTSTNDVLVLSDRAWKMKDTNTNYDMTDHKDAIQMDARTAWVNFGTPTIDKRWVRFWVNSIQGGFTLSVDQYGNYLETLLGSNDILFKSTTKLTVKDEIKAKIDKLSAISVGFRNAEKNKLVRIQGFEIEYAPDYDASEPKR